MSKPYPSLDMAPSSNFQFLSTPSEKTEYIHNFMNTLQLSNYYNDTIKSKKLEWLLDVENAGELVQWISSYIGPENILNEEEITCLELTAEGTPDTSVLSQHQLDDVLSSSFEVTDESVASIEEDILELDTFIAVIRQQDETLRPKSKSLQDDVLQQHERCKSVQQQVQKKGHTCIKASQKLGSARARFMKCILPLNNILNKSHTDREIEDLGLLSQMPIKDLVAKYDRAFQNIDFIRSRNHLEQEITSGINETSSPLISGKNKTILRRTLQKLTFAKEITIEAKYKLVIENLDKQENLVDLELKSKLTNELKADQFQSSGNKLRIQLADFEEKIEDYQQTSPVSELINEIERLMNAHVTQIFHKLVDKAKRHQANNFECRQMMLKCVEAHVYHKHLFFILLVDEKHKLIIITKLLQEYEESLNEDFQQLTECIEKMKMISGGQVLKLQDGEELYERKSLQKMLLSLAPVQSSLEGEQSVDALKSLEERIRSDELALLHTSFQVVEETLIKNLQYLQAMVKLLFSGPTKKPVIVDADLSSQLYDIALFVKQLRSRLAELVAECKVVSETRMTNKYFKSRRLLWVYFLTDCVDIGALIADMEREVCNQED